MITKTRQPKPSFVNSPYFIMTEVNKRLTSYYQSLTYVPYLEFYTDDEGVRSMSLHYIDESGDKCGMIMRNIAEDVETNIRRIILHGHESVKLLIDFFEKKLNQKENSNSHDDDDILETRQSLQRIRESYSVHSWIILEVDSNITPIGDFNLISDKIRTVPDEVADDESGNYVDIFMDSAPAEILSKLLPDKDDDEIGMLVHSYIEAYININRGFIN